MKKPGVPGRSQLNAMKKVEVVDLALLHGVDEDKVPGKQLKNDWIEALLALKGELTGKIGGNAGDTKEVVPSEKEIWVMKKAEVVELAQSHGVDEDSVGGKQLKSDWIEALLNYAKKTGIETPNDGSKSK